MLTIRNTYASKSKFVKAWCLGRRHCNGPDACWLESRVFINDQGCAMDIGPHYFIKNNRINTFVHILTIDYDFTYSIKRFTWSANKWNEEGQIADRARKLLQKDLSYETRQLAYFPHEMRNIDRCIQETCAALETWNLK